MRCDSLPCIHFCTEQFCPCHTSSHFQRCDQFCENLFHGFPIFALVETKIAALDEHLCQFDVSPLVAGFLLAVRPLPTGWRARQSMSAAPSEAASAVAEPVAHAGHGGAAVE